MLKTLLIVALGLGVSLRADESAQPAPASTAPAPEASAAPVSFTGQQLELKKRMEDLFEVSKNVNQLDAKTRDKARGEIDRSLDWDRVAEDALGSGTWKKQPAKNREDFRGLLRDVIVRTAYTRLDKFWDGAKYTFDKIEVKSGKAHVVAKFVVNEDPFLLEYFLLAKGGRWLIYDIAFEGERYSVNISEQINAFLREKSFAYLLDKLRKRRDELISDAAGKSKRKG